MSLFTNVNIVMASISGAALTAAAMSGNVFAAAFTGGALALGSLNAITGSIADAARPETKAEAKPSARTPG